MEELVIPLVHSNVLNTDAGWFCRSLLLLDLMDHHTKQIRRSLMYLSRSCNLSYFNNSNLF
jgi:hypothetical protein